MVLKLPLSVPFHFGTYDANDRAAGKAQAANELTRSAWVCRMTVVYMRLELIFYVTGSYQQTGPPLIASGSLSQTDHNLS